MMNRVDIKEFLDRDERKDMLRLLSAGSVDDGKSTLIGRLLFDSKKIYEDQLDALKRDSRRVGSAGEGIDYALLLDGLKAEREQGITIDVAYRYFSTNARKFIIADTPGHEQYTRNMITGGSTADLAIILVDARTGVVTQTRRHTYLVSLLGIRNVVLAVNKMDLVDYAESRFRDIVDEYRAFAAQLPIAEITSIPISAINGDNVVVRSARMEWYGGVALLEFLERVELSDDRCRGAFRYSVQYVLRPNLDFRGFSGRIASGVIARGDEVVALPSNCTSRVKQIFTPEGERDEAYSGESVTITLEDEIDISRGEMLVRPDAMPMVGCSVEAMLVWMDEQPMDRSKRFYLKHTTQTMRATIDNIAYRVDINTLERCRCNALSLNEIAKVRISTNRSLIFDRYSDNRQCGSFILIDPITNNTSAVGMILGEAEGGDIERYEECGEVFIVTEGAAKLAERLRQEGKRVFVVDIAELSDDTTRRVCESAAAQGIYAIGVVAQMGDYEV